MENGCNSGLWYDDIRALSMAHYCIYELRMGLMDGTKTWINMEN